MAKLHSSKVVSGVQFPLEALKGGNMTKLRSWTRKNPVKIRVHDSIPRCEGCNARLDFITPWNQPHFCKEVTYSSMPVLNFIPFGISEKD